MKNFKKVSAIFLSTLLLLGAVFVPLTVSTVSAAPAATESLIYGKLPAWSNHTANGVISNIGEADYGAITDGNTGAHKDYNNAIGTNFMWVLDGNYDITAFGMWMHERVVSYEVYVGNNADTIFDAGNLLYTHTYVDKETETAQQKAAGDEGFTSRTGSVVALKITGAYFNDPNYSVGSNKDTCARIKEFAIFGTKSETAAAEKSHTLKTVAKYNLHADRDASIIANTAPYSNSAGGSNHNNTTLTNGLGVNDGGESNIDLWNVDHKIVYDLKGLYDVTGFAVYNRHTTLFYGYSVYVGNDPATLFSGTPVYTYAPPTSGGTAIGSKGVQYTEWDRLSGQKTTLTEGNYALGKYVGIQFNGSAECGGDNSARPTEIQVFGKKATNAVIERGALASDATTDNLLSGISWSFKWNDLNPVYNKGNEWSNTYVGTAHDGSNITRINDGTISTAHADLFAYYTKYVYQLDTPTKIEAFLLYNRQNNVQTSAYKVYAGNSVTDLFTDANCIYSYDYMVGSSDPLDRTYVDGALQGTVDASKVTTGGQYVEFYGDAAKTATYVGIWLIDTESDTETDGAVALNSNGNDKYNISRNFRISEIGVYGTEVGTEKTTDTYYVASGNSKSNYATVADKLDAGFTYDNSLLKGTKPVVWYENANTNSTNVHDNFATWTDGSTDSEIALYSLVGDKIVYSFGALTDVTGFALWHNHQTLKESYNVYVGYNQSTLFSAENLVFAYDYEDIGRSMAEAVKFQNPAKGLYLGIEFTRHSTNDGMARVTEVAAWGTTEEMDYTMAPSIGAMADANSAKTNADDVNLLAGLKATTGYLGTNHSNGKDYLEGITDGVANLHYDFAHTNYSTSKSSELIYDLGYVSQVNEFAFWMTCAGRQFSYEVYMGDSYDTMFAEPAIVWDYNYAPDSLGQKFTFDTPKSVRYIAIRLGDTRNGPNTDMYRISEIAAFGTLGGAGEEFVEINSAEVTVDGKALKYDATYYFPAGIKQETVTEIGSLVYPTTALAGAELTLNTAGASKATAPVDAMETVNAYDEAGYTAVRATNTFTGADKVGQTTKLTARAYITLSDGTTYYSAPYSYSVTQIKRLAAKKYKQFFENDTDYITNKGYNGAIDTVWSDLQTTLAGVATNKETMLAGAEGWLTDIKAEYGITDDMLYNGYVSSGDTARLSAVIRKLMRGESVTVVQIGGSITEGYFADDNLSQGDRVVEFLNAAFPGKVTFHNAGIAATGATFGAYRLAQDVLAKTPDLVIVEYNINDHRDDAKAIGAYEDIIRRLLSEDIAVISLSNVTYNNSDNQYNVILNATGTERSHRNIAHVYKLPTVSTFDAFHGTSIYGQGEGKYFAAGEATHPSNVGHAAVGALVSNLIYNVMLDIENQSTEAVAMPSAPMTEFGGLIGTAADVYSGADIQAGTDITVSGATYNAGIVQQVGNADIRENHSYGIYTLASGETATITVKNASDLFLLTASNANGSKAATFKVADADGNVLNEGTFSAYYVGALTTESSRIIESERFYSGAAQDVTVTITAVDGQVQFAGVLATLS